MYYFTPESKWEKKEMHPDTFIFQFGTLGNIVFVLDRLEENKPSIRNIKQYLLAALYNSLMTTEAYYHTRCNNEIFKNEGGLKNE